MADWVCEDCGSINPSEVLKCGCGYGGRVKAANYAEEASEAPQINHAEVCGANPLYQQMIATARLLETRPREELVSMAAAYEKEFTSKMQMMKPGSMDDPKRQVERWEVIDGPLMDVIDGPDGPIDRAEFRKKILGV